MKKKFYTKVFGVLISFNKVMNFQSFEFDASDVIPMNAQNISPPVFFSYFCSFYRE